jgi:hypothetical protein
MPCQQFQAGWIHPRTNRPGPAGTWCQTLEEAQARAIACPSDCFIYDDGPTSHHYRPIPGPGPCAHYVAHELNISVGRRYERCRLGRSVMIAQITQGRMRRPLRFAQLRDIWTNQAETHSGVVIAVNRSAAPIEVRIRACSTAGNVYTSAWRTDGWVHQ